MNFLLCLFTVYDFRIRVEWNITHLLLTLPSLLTFSSTVRPLRAPETQKKAARKHGAKHSCRERQDVKVEVHRYTRESFFNARKVKINTKINTLKQNVSHFNSTQTMKGVTRTKVSETDIISQDCIEK